jgi:hypothetical protein
MAEVKTPWHKKDPRVVWRGKIKMAELRKELVRVSEGKSWSDIKPVVINDAKDKHTKDVMNLRQFCGYALILRWCDTTGTDFGQIQVYGADRGHIVFWATEIPSALPFSTHHASLRMARVPYPPSPARWARHQLH